MVVVCAVVMVKSLCLAHTREITVDLLFMEKGEEAEFQEFIEN